MALDYLWRQPPSLMILREALLKQTELAISKVLFQLTRGTLH